MMTADLALVSRSCARSKCSWMSLPHKMFSALAKDATFSCPLIKFSAVLL